MLTREAEQEAEFFEKKLQDSFLTGFVSEELVWVLVFPTQPHSPSGALAQCFGPLD